MKKETVYAMESSVYPGLFRANPETQRILDRMEHNPRSMANLIMPGVEKQSDHIRIELMLPGLDRENIIISGYDNLLSVILLSNGTGEHDMSAKKNHRRKSHSRNFLLPGNADGEFGAATYKDGYLNIYIPTGTILPYKPKSYRIMVY